VIKTVHLTNAWHEQSGGIRTFYQALMAAARVHERPIRLIVPAPASSVEDVNEFARIYRVSAPASPFIDSRYRLILPHRILFGVGEVWRILRAERPDLVEVCDKYSLIYLGGLIRAGLLGGWPRPAVASLTCERMDDNVSTFLNASRVARRASGQYMRVAYGRQFDGHIAISRYTAQELEAVPRPVHVAPLGIDAALFGQATRSGEQRRVLYGRIGADPETTLLLYAGRLSAEKNLQLLLDSMTLLGSGCRRMHLAVIGDGPLRDWLAREGQATGRVSMVGHVADRQTLAACYANADVFVHPNPREPFGIGPLEAMAAGAPLVAPSSGGVLEYASPQNAWLAEPTARGFADAIQDVLRDPLERARRVARAKATAAGFDWPLVTSRFFEVYDRIHAESDRWRWITKSPDHRINKLPDAVTPPRSRFDRA